MQLTAAFTLGRRRAHRERAARHGHPAASRTTPPIPPAGRPRRTDPPQDTAFYTCTCGFAWTGAVTTSVGCPHCGTAQAW
jgi:hypothetical protein